MSKIYRGWESPHGGVGVIKEVDGRSETLDPRYDLRVHSTVSFEWGYVGLGTAQLALAILADYLGDDARAVALHQSFTRQVVACLPEKEWALTSEIIDAALRSIDDNALFQHWVDHEAHKLLGVPATSGVRVLDTDLVHHRAKLDAESLFTAPWIDVPDHIPVPPLAGQDEKRGDV